MTGSVLSLCDQIEVVGRVEIEAHLAAGERLERRHELRRPACSAECLPGR